MLQCVQGLQIISQMNIQCNLLQSFEVMKSLMVHGSGQVLLVTKKRIMLNILLVLIRKELELVLVRW